MPFRVPMCRPLETAGFWTSRNLIVDGVLLAEGGAGALLGLCGLRFVPMALLAVGWKVGEYLVKACAPLSVVPAGAALRPAFADLAVVMGAWVLGRLARWAVQRRRRESLAHIEPGLSVDEPSPWQSRQWPGAEPRQVVGPERSWTTPGAIVLELEDNEADALRAAIDSRLEDLRRVADRPSPGGVRDEIWQTVATLEAILARLPAAHLYGSSDSRERAAGSSWSRSGHRL
jgi:hypothetical protein